MSRCVEGQEEKDERPSQGLFIEVYIQATGMLSS